MEADNSNLWERAKGIFISSLNSAEDKSQAEGYFTMVSSARMEDGKFVFSTINKMCAEFLKANFSEKLKFSLQLAGMPAEMQLEFKVDEESSQKIFIPETDEKKQTFSPQKTQQFISTMPLEDNFTFEEFVQGPSNSWAFAAAKGVANNPGQKNYNPLFIHGGTGLGKTHLMQAIGNELKVKNPKMSVCYLTAETFLNEYVNALQKKGMDSFREKYRFIDVLLVDDIQFLQKGKMCQEEFFNTFNYLTTNHKQIVMTSDVAPKNLPSLEERLISRFEGGMVQEIEAPGLETRLAILKKKAENLHPSVPDSALTYIAEHIKSHVRAMEGALSKVHISITASPMQELTSDYLSFILKDLIAKEQSFRNITIKEIQETVARKYGVSMEQILSTDRTQSLVTPRQLAMYISRKCTSKSLLEIATSFEKKHATILHGVKTIEKRLDVEQDLKDSLDKILSELGYKAEDII